MLFTWSQLHWNRGIYMSKYALVPTPRRKQNVCAQKYNRMSPFPESRHLQNPEPASLLAECSFQFPGNCFLQRALSAL